MAEQITLDQIPGSTLKPGVYTEFNTKLARSSLPTNLRRVLIYAQRLATGSVPALQIVDVFTDKQAAEYFGVGSMAHRAVALAIEANPYAQIAVVTVDDKSAGTEAVTTLDLVAATGRGMLTFFVGVESVDVGLESGMTAADQATAIVKAASGLPALPVIVTATADKLTIKAKHKGEAGNEIKVRLRTRYSSGQTTMIAATLAGGQGNPDLRPAYDAAFGSSYEIRVCPFSDKESLLAFRDHLEALANPMEKRETIGVAGFPGTLAGATTVTAEINSPIISYAWYNKSRKTSVEIAAGYATVMASEEHPARPLNYLQIKGLDVIDQENYPSRKEQENALHNGVTPLEVGPGNRVQIVRAISTYLVDQQKNPDDTCLDITVFQILHYVAKAVRQALSQQFPRELATQRTRDKIRTVGLRIAYQCEELEILQNIDDYKDRLVVQPHPQNKGMTVMKMPAPIVHGLHVIAARIDLYV